MILESPIMMSKHVKATSSLVYLLYIIYPYDITVIDAVTIKQDTEYIKMIRSKTSLVRSIKTLVFPFFPAMIMNMDHHDLFRLMTR